MIQNNYDSCRLIIWIKKIIGQKFIKFILINKNVPPLLCFSCMFIIWKNFMMFHLPSSLFKHVSYVANYLKQTNDSQVIYNPKFSLTLEVLDFGGKSKFFINKGCWNLGNWRNHDWSSLNNILLDTIFEIPLSSKIKIYLTSNVKVAMKCNINLLVLILIVAYFYCTKVFQVLYSIHKKSMESWRPP